MDKFVASCEQKFGPGLPMEACLGLLGELFQLEMSTGGGNGSGGGIRQCPEEWERTQDPPITHNREHFAGPCTSLELWTLRFVFPVLQVLCLAGNVFNLMVYRLPYFGHNSAVNLLRAKAIANLLFVQCRLLECLHAWIPLNPQFEWIYWHTRPYLITLANLNGTCATWMTMLISIQTCVCVFWPFSFRRLCARRPTFCALFGSAACAACIHSLFLLTHQVVPDPSLLLVRLPSVSSGSPLPEPSLPFLWCFRILTSFRMRPSAWAAWLERPYYWVQMSATIVLPTLVMLFCTALIVSRFTLKPQLGQAFSQRRKCVIRLTVATTGSHLLLEGPATISYVVFALRGASMHDQSGWICGLAAANNVLSALNATIPFFLFLLCSSQFRRLLLSGTGAASGPSLAKLSNSQCPVAPSSNDRGGEFGARNGNGGGGGPERHKLMRNNTQTKEEEEEEEEETGTGGTWTASVGSGGCGGSETLL